MRSATTHLPEVMPKTFAELNDLHPLRPINDVVELRNAEEVVDRLAVLDKCTKDQNDYLQTLTLLMDAFESQEIADAMDRRKSSGLDALKYLMDSTAMKQTDLATVLEVGPAAVSMILSGDRPITADHARKLGKRFEVSPAVFL